MAHKATSQGKAIHGRRILHLSLRDGEFVFLSQIKKRLLYHVNKKEVISAQRRLQLASHIRRLADSEIDAINQHIQETGSEAVVNGNCQLLSVQDAQKLYHYVVQRHGQPPHLAEGNNQPDKTNVKSNSSIHQHAHSIQKGVETSAIVSQPDNATSTFLSQKGGRLLKPCEMVPSMVVPVTGTDSIETREEVDPMERNAEEVTKRESEQPPETRGDSAEHKTGERHLETMALSLTDRLRCLSASMRSPAETTQPPTLTAEREMMSSDVNNNRAERTWLSECSLSSPGNTAMPTLKRELDTQQANPDYPPEKSPKRDQTKEISVYNFVDDDKNESGDFYPNGKSARIIKRRQAVESSENPSDEQLDASKSMNPKPKASGHSIKSHKKSKVRVLGSKLARSDHTPFLQRISNPSEPIVVKSSVQDQRQVQVESSGVSYEVGMLVINGKSLQYILMNSVRYVARSELYRQLLPPSKGIYGICNFHHLCRIHGIVTRTVERKDLPYEIIKDETSRKCKRGFVFFPEEQVLKIYRKYLAYEDKKKKKFCPRSMNYLKAANNTTDVINMLQKGDLSVPVKKIGPKLNTKTRGGNISPKKSSQVDTSSQLSNDVTSAVHGQSSLVSNTVDSSSRSLSVSQPPDLTLPTAHLSISTSHRSLSTLGGTLENTSNISAETLPSSDFTASAFIKSNYEVLAQDPYTGPLASVDMMNSTVEELGIRRPVNSSHCRDGQWERQMNKAAGLQAASGGVKSEENNNILPVAPPSMDINRPASDKCTDSPPQGSLYQVPEHQEEIRQLRQELDQAKQTMSDRCGSTEAMLNEFYSSQKILEQQIRKLVGLNGKIATTLVSLVQELEGEKKANKKLSEEIQAFSEQDSTQATDM